MRLMDCINKKRKLNKEYELRSIEKIFQINNERDSLQANIGWNEPHHEVDSSEAMKSHVSEQIRGKNKVPIFYN